MKAACVYFIFFSAGMTFIRGIDNIERNAPYGWLWCVVCVCEIFLGLGLALCINRHNTISEEEN